MSISCSMKTSFIPKETFNNNGSTGFCSSPYYYLPPLKQDFMGNPIHLSAHNDNHKISHLSIHAQASICVSRSLQWWKKTLEPNMIEINSAQELVDSLSNAGDRLVIVEFYSPGCGGCKSLHPKMCQLAESNSNAVFLKVNYERLNTMCRCLHIHVLPFFRFYRGEEGKLCSFSCTNATIKKFKDALTKYGTDRFNLGPAKGLDESELLKLAAIGEISMYLPLKQEEDKLEDLILKRTDLSKCLDNKMRLKEENVLLIS